MRYWTHHRQSAILSRKSLHSVASIDKDAFGALSKAPTDLVAGSFTSRYAVCYENVQFTMRKALAVALESTALIPVAGYRYAKKSIILKNRKSYLARERTGSSAAMTILYLSY